MKYDLEYFIEKFEAIPSNKWTTKKFNKGECKCAFGHLGCEYACDDTKESMKLIDIIGGVLGCITLVDVNDGKKQFDHLGSTPKERVINYLKSLRK